ncbi:MAG: hypothetical protein LBL07_06125 [Tannerella sp.]|jgi:hypothetical protein|nr:hypothetical protein [Tannerella sp.]
MLNLTNEQKQSIAIMLQLKPYKGQKLDEELIHSILAELEKSVHDIEKVLEEHHNPSMGVGPWTV